VEERCKQTIALDDGLQEEAGVVQVSSKLHGN